MTEGQRYKRRRNLAVYAAWRTGPPFSMRLLAGIFDMSRGNVAAEVAKLRAEELADSGRAALAACDARYSAWLLRLVRETERPRGQTFGPRSAPARRRAGRKTVPGE